MKQILFVLALSFSFCVAEAQTSVTNELTLDAGVAKHAGIDEIYRKFSKAYRDLDSAAFRSLYSRDAAYLVPGNDIDVGNPVIVKSFDDFFKQMKAGGSELRISFRIVQRKVDASMGYDVGIYTLKTIKDGKEVHAGRGKFVVVAIREGDEWRFQVDGYSDMPKQ